MACQTYRSTNFRAERLARITQALEILADYPDQKLTARQVYYQFVARGLLENSARSYQNLTALLTDARYAGLIDWDAIEDRGREPDSPQEWENIDDLVETALRAFRLPRWKGQANHVELWVEKQALAGVLAPIARRYHVTLMVNKGYSSASAMKESADRMRLACGMEDNDEEDSHRKPIVLYLGDHDPSGEDMVRDIRDRLVEFGVHDLEVRKLALTMEQIRRFNPPPNPAKTTDSRAGAYIALHGAQSWELDALPPNELNRLIEAEFREVLDTRQMNLVIAEEDAARTRLRKALAEAGKKR